MPFTWFCVLGVQSFWYKNYFSQTLLFFTLYFVNCDVHHLYRLKAASRCIINVHKALYIDPSFIICPTFERHYLKMVFIPSMNELRELFSHTIGIVTLALY